jgi:nucleoside-diphosphate-sugar epimerase
VNVLITGASGFVGGACLTRFAGVYGARTFGTGRRASPLENYAARDLSQPFDLPFRPDVVVHCAARSSPWGSANAFERANVDATRNVIDFCERVGRPRLVHVSTTAVFYRNADQMNLTEDAPIGPRFVNRYAATKYASERLVAGYSGSSVIVRPRAVFGPGDTTLFPRVLRAARAGRLPLIARPGPPARSDLVYIDTLVDYLYAAATSDVRGAFNVTNGEPVETIAFVLDVLRRVGAPVPSKRVDARVAFAGAAVIEAAYRAFAPASEPPITRFGVAAFAYAKTFDIAKARAAYGPPSTSLDDGVAAFVRHVVATGA